MKCLRCGKETKRTIRMAGQSDPVPVCQSCSDARRAALGFMCRPHIEAFDELAKDFRKVLDKDK